MSEHPDPLPSPTPGVFGQVPVSSRPPVGVDDPLEPAPARAHQRILDWVEAELRASRLKVGDQLPGERALAETHGISRASVRDAIRTLEVMGLVRTSVGSGPRSGAVLISRPAKGMATMLRMHVASSGLQVEDIVEVRALLESWAATVADLSELPDRGHAILEEAESLLDDMDEIDLDRTEFQALDTRFHVLLARLASNRVLDAMMASLKDAIGDYVAAGVPSDEQWAPIAVHLRQQHREIFAAVSSERHDDAAELLRRHIEWFYAATLGAQEHGDAARDDADPDGAHHPPRVS